MRKRIKCVNMRKHAQCVNMRNATRAGTQTSNEWPYYSFLYCGLAQLEINNDVI